jgi:Tfp pilus assembly protein PilF
MASSQLSDPAQALHYYEQAAALAPEDRAVLLPLADCYTSLGQHDKAIAALEAVVASFGTSRSKELAQYHHRLGKAYQAHGELPQAKEHFDAAFKLDLGNVDVLRDYGLFCFEQGDLDGAQKKFRALLLQRLDKTTGLSKADVYYYLGEITLRQGDKAKAKGMFDRALAEDSGHSLAQTARSAIA